MLDSSVPIILDQVGSYDPTLAANDNRGMGWTVAVLDTGIEKTNAFLGLASRIVSEACYSTLGGEPGSEITTCPGGVDVSITGLGKGIPCDINEYDQCNHGTLMAGIVAGNGSTYDGVATGSDLMSVNVSSYDLSAPNVVVVYEDDVLAGLERALTVHNENNGIALSSVLLAFGGQAAQLGNCDDDYGPLKTVIDSLKAQGVATVAAAGNDGYSSGINAPACISSAIAVGASTDADAKWTLSNEGSSLNLYAPGVGITSSDIGGADKTSGGTSFAAAHVSGAWAVLKQATPNATVSQITSMLQNTGAPVEGNTPSGAKRIDLKRALGSLLTIIKKVINSTGGTAEVDNFSLSVNAATSTSFAISAATSTPLIFNDETPNRTEGDTTIYTANTLTVATSTPFILSEDDLPGYDEGDWSCTNGGGGPYGSGSVVSAAVGEVICTIINDDIEPGLTILKDVTNNSGGVATSTDFVLRLTGGTLPGSTYDGTEDMVSGDTPAAEANAEYTLSEDQEPGYSQVGIVCKDDDTGDDLGHPVTLAEGQSVTCTITSDDIAPTLTLTTDPTNDDGGSALPDAFLLKAGALSATSGSPISGVKSNTDYLLSETLVDGYTFVNVVCTSDIDSSSNEGTFETMPMINLAEGEDVACTITNDDDAPTLTLTKEPTNDDGGNALPDAFLLKAGAFSATSGSPVSGVEWNTDYLLSETPLDGYTFVNVVCTSDLSGSSNAGTFESMPTINLAVGEDVACTITNDDIAPELTIMKHVINDNNGKAEPAHFILRLTGDVFDGSVPRYSGDLITVNANTVYTLSEDQLPGYSLVGIECKDIDTEIVLPHPVTLAEGQSVTCTISNLDYVSSFYVIPLPNGGAAVINL